MSNTLKLGEKIGAGRTAEIYSLTDNTIAKVFLPQFGIKIAEVEYNFHKAISKCGLPIPKVYDIIDVDGRTSIIYQKLSGISLLDAIKKSPTKIKKYAYDMADLHYDIGSQKAPKELSSFKERIESGIQRQELLKADEKKGSLSVLSTLPDGDSICHADFHPENIIVEGDKYWVIDWVTACSGSLEADYTRTNIILKYSASLHAKAYEKILSSLFGNSFSSFYTRRLIENGINLDKAKLWQLPIIAARLAENVSPQENKKLLKIIRSQLN